MQSPISLPISFSFFKLPVQEEYPTVALWKRYSMFRSPAFWSCWVKPRPATAENISVSGWLGGEMEISVFWKAPKWGKEASIRGFCVLFWSAQIKIIGHIMRDVHRVAPEMNSWQANLHHLKMSSFVCPPSSTTVLQHFITFLSFQIQPTWHVWSSKCPQVQHNE